MPQRDVIARTVPGVREAEALCARIAFTRGRGSEGDVPLARKPCLEAINAAILAGSGTPDGQLEAARAARAVSPVPQANWGSDLLMLAACLGREDDYVELAGRARGVRDRRRRRPGLPSAGS
ncbi:hypothetical protein R1T08_38255 [Streptomyces sp. SBC-4]|nr:hypothetical protein [Streptomyces sp. SBC-4]MDV5149792.1 hypothetical protein [Streptomyces sp. SBC-4]